ncbi:MAG: dihydrodipicolinate synthase family protein [Actinobacteria bacterium]|nr:dihydrodipicolinate synthase family protein [Actinomycetota bacterium]
MRRPVPTDGGRGVTPSPLHGVLPVIQTPFAADGSVDHDALEHELHWVLDQGVAGLTTGMVSETLRLSDTERREVARAVCAAAVGRGRAAVISCGAESTREAVRLAQDAQAAGASALMAIPPVTVVIDEADVLAYYSAILAAVEVPVVVQDASGYVGNPLSIGVQVAILDRFGDRVYFKPEAAPIGQRLSDLREATGGRARAFEGSGGAAVVDSFRRGIVVGTMPGAEVCWAVQQLWQACERGDWDLAYDLSGPLTLLVAIQTSVDAYVAVEKHLLHAQGVLPSTAVREPVGYRLDPETAAEVDRLADRLRVAMPAAS